MTFKEGVMIVVIPLLVEKELWGPFDRAILLIVMLKHKLSV